MISAVRSSSNVHTQPVHTGTTVAYIAARFAGPTVGIVARHMTIVADAQLVDPTVGRELVWASKLGMVESELA
jgi:hypothetical protein